MVESGIEIIIGITNDDQFGPMLLVGLGGVFVEVFKDTTLYPLPINHDEAIMMLKN
ncbi:acetate--CoA ligase family protein [Clostridioides difficile]|nr:acetate--CoA ligase family protein [Clostridioides difficile]